LAAVKGRGGVFHRNTEEKTPPKLASPISAYRGQPILEILIFATLKVTWNSETPRNVSPGDILASVPVLTSVHLILHWQCHDQLLLEPSQVLWASARLCVVTAGFRTSSHRTQDGMWLLWAVAYPLGAVMGALLLHN